MSDGSEYHYILIIFSNIKHCWVYIQYGGWCTMFQSIQRWLKISLSSSKQKLSTYSWFSFTFTNSSTMETFHSSWGWIWQYLKFLASSTDNSSILVLPVERRIFRKLRPVVDQVSCWMTHRNCPRKVFLLRFIKLMKLMNLFSSRVFIYSFLLIGSMKYLWVCLCLLPAHRRFAVVCPAHR